MYTGTADLYAYFIERALSLLNEHGQFSFIVANKWMRANYGRPLRQFLKTKRIEEIVDFGDLPVFENATTYPCIIRISDGEPAETFTATNVESLQFEDLKTYVRDKHIEIRQVSLNDDGWSLNSQYCFDLVNRLRAECVSLNQYTKGQMYWGIKTGLNAAFVSDENTHSSLIGQEPECKKIIKSFVSGREIKRYQTVAAKQYLLYIPWHFPLQDNGSIEGASKEAEYEFKKKISHCLFPVIRIQKTC
ncbi:MAG: Eco57I restriction-modification methylase domain-containing protein [Methanospirillum sp.]